MKYELSFHIKIQQTFLILENKLLTGIVCIFVSQVAKKYELITNLRSSLQLF